LVVGFDDFRHREMYYRVSHVKCSTGESHDENQFQYIAFF
jgi:hypothetical protein